MRKELLQQLIDTADEVNDNPGFGQETQAGMRLQVSNTAAELGVTPDESFWAGALCGAIALNNWFDEAVHLLVENGNTDCGGDLSHIMYHATSESLVALVRAFAAHLRDFDELPRGFNPYFGDEAVA